MYTNVGVVEELLPIEGKPISIFADENAEYKNFFYLGTSAYDMKDYAILITKIVDGIEGFKGIMGRLLFVRGSITANVVSGMSDIGVYKAYNGVIMFKNNIGGNQVIKEIKKVSYKNEYYLALICNPTLKHDVYFTGIIKDVLFQYVPLEEVVTQ